MKKEEIKKIAVLVGSIKRVFEDGGHLKDIIEKELKTEIIKSKGTYWAKLKDKEFLFYSCYCTSRSKFYVSSVKYIKRKFGFNPPEPLDEVMEKIPSVDLILFFGTCGAISGEKNEIYLPEKFYKLNLRSEWITEKTIEKINPNSPLKCNNYLSKLAEGKQAKVLTSNLSFVKSNTVNGDMNILNNLSKKLKPLIDCVEKESYYLVRKYKNKIPLGIFLMSSDVVGKHKTMTFQLRIFQKSISKILKKLK